MEVLKKPIITEKFTQLGEEENQYGFICDPKANKIQIKREVEKLYGVKVNKVRTMVYPPKQKTRYTKTNIIEGKTKRYKKAVVTLKEGNTIDFYSNI
ncbi:MAG: 50S ribosomal protein L23 [Bacteroidetes bacterium SW_10_40_5]|nr:MAG: 50S ribosomal protein L23 [Bacteroidetes bacterium SW_10_40_5]